MTPKKIKTRIEDKSAVKDYLKKATDNHAEMLSALQNNNYNAVGTLAVQCAISLADAICVYEKGIRSISNDHFDVCDIVQSISLPESKEKSSVLKRIISKKNLIQYERRSIYQSEAQEIAKLANRFYQWVVTSIKE